VPIPPALDTAAARAPPDVRAMPASMMGYSMPKSLVKGVFRGGGDDIVNCKTGMGLKLCLQGTQDG
jgi:hypothetical protein